jgi:hypothetical protein
MTDLVLSPALKVARNRFRYIDNTGVTRGVYTGVVQTTSYGGDRVACSLDFAAAGGLTAASKSERAQIISRLMELKGRQNRLYLTDSAYERTRGTWSDVCGGELIIDPYFTDLATNWTASPTASIVEASSDGAYKGTLTVNISVSTDFLTYNNAAAIPVTLNAPYVQRWWIKQGRYAGTMQLRFRNAANTAIGTGYETVLTSPNGYYLSVYTTDSTTLRPTLNLNAATGTVAGDYMQVPFISCSRCFYVDGGGNVLLQSDDFTTTWTNTRSTDSANTATDPNGTVTGDSIIEDATASNTHLISQNVTVTASAVDFCFSVALKANTRTWAQLVLTETTGPSSVSSYFNLATGALGTATTGANFVGTRAFTRDLGNGWYLCTVIGRKTNAATTITCAIRLATADGTSTYSGDGASSIFAWRATFTQSSVPSRLIQSTSGTVAAASQPGSAIYVKGLPASQTGLLVLGDWVEIDGQIKMITAPLDSDSSGMGYLQFSPPLRRPVSGDTPVIVTKPMGRFILASGNPEFANEPGVFSTASLEFEEAYA